VLEGERLEGNRRASAARDVKQTRGYGWSSAGQARVGRRWKRRCWARYGPGGPNEGAEGEALSGAGVASREAAAARRRSHQSGQGLPSVSQEVERRAGGPHLDTLPCQVVGLHLPVARHETSTASTLSASSWPRAEKSALSEKVPVTLLHISHERRPPQGSFGVDVKVNSIAVIGSV